LELEELHHLREAHVHHAREAERTARAARPGEGADHHGSAAVGHVDDGVDLARRLGAEAHDGRAPALDVAVEEAAVFVFGLEAHRGHALAAHGEHRIALAGLELEAVSAALALLDLAARGRAEHDVAAG